MAELTRKKPKKPKPRRQKLSPIAEEMKQWSAMLGQELARWPHVKSRPMFGLLAFYRRAKIFAGLPVTRGLKSSHSIIFKIQPMPPELLRRATDDPHVDTESGIPGAKWYSFELTSAEDLRDALWWLSQAYERAK
jgi:hypothetical protein